jgi:CRP-like cAMP-binding protein
VTYILISNFQAIYQLKKKLVIYIVFYSSKKDGVDREHRVVVKEQEWRTTKYGSVSTMSKENRVRLCEELCASLTSSHEVSEGALNAVPLLCGCETKVKRDILARIIKRVFTAGECICREGEKDSSGMFFLLEGQCQVQVDGVDIITIRPALYRFRQKNGMQPGGAGKQVKENVRGFFGEFSLLAPPEMAKRTATVRAVTEVQVGELSRHDFSAVLAAHSSFRASIQKKTAYLFAQQNQSSVCLTSALVEKSPLLRNLDPICRHTLLANVTEEEFENREHLCKQGEQGTCLFICKSGTIEVTVDDKHVRNLTTGDIFGEQLAMAAIFENGCKKRSRRGRTASAIAKGRVEVLKLELEDFRHLVDWWPAFCHEMKSLRDCMYDYGFTLPMFDSMPHSARNMVMSALTKCVISKGQVLFRQTMHRGDSYECTFRGSRNPDLNEPLYPSESQEPIMFFIHEGTVAIIVDGQELAHVTAGDYFGEHALLSPKNESIRRTATVVARTDCRLYELRRSDFDAILQWHPNFATELSSKHDYVFDQRSNIIKAASGGLLFDGCSVAVKNMLVSCLRRVKVKANAIVMMQGEDADYIAFVIRGTAQVFVGGEHLGFMKAGDIVGQASILTSKQKRGATIRATTDLVSTLYRLPLYILMQI